MMRRDVLMRKCQKGLVEVSINGIWKKCNIIDDFENAIPNLVNIPDWDFESRVGYACKNNDGTITLYVHSNRSHKMRLIETKKEISKAKKITNPIMKLSQDSFGGGEYYGRATIEDKDLDEWFDYSAK
jgi:hypothetical protein